MQKQPKVSIVIPTYNRAKYTKRAIESVLEQTYKNVEIIVVDDGSTDNTKKILEPFIKQKQIKYFYQPNSGPSAARNLGIKNSKGEFIAFLDSDDEWLPEKLEKQIMLFQNSGDKKLGFVGCNVIIVSKALNKTFEYKISRYENLFELRESLKWLMWIPGVLLTKKKILEEVGLFDESLRFGEDWDIWVKVTKKYNFNSVPDYLIKYYVQPCYLGSIYCRGGDIQRGRKLFLESIKVNPLNLKSYFYFLLSIFGSNFYNKLYYLTLPLRRDGIHRFIASFLKKRNKKITKSSSSNPYL